MMKKGKSVYGVFLDSIKFQSPHAVGDIWKDREKIEKHVSASDSASDCPSLAKKRHIVRDANFEKPDQACYFWFLPQRSKGAPVLVH